MCYTYRCREVQLMKNRLKAILKEIKKFLIAIGTSLIANMLYDFLKGRLPF